MANNIIHALDASLSRVVFTDRMKQTVLQRVRQMRIEEALQQKQRRPFRAMLPVLAGVTAAILLFVSLTSSTNYLNLVGDPVNTPPDLGDTSATFLPIVTNTPDASPVAYTDEPTSIPTAEPTDTPEPVIVPAEEPTAVPTAEPTEIPTAGPILTMSVLDVTPASTEAAATSTPTEAPTPTPSPTPTATPTEEPTPTPTPSPTPTATPTEEPTPTPTPSPTPTATPTEEPTPTPTPSPTPTATVQPTATPDPAKIVYESDRIVVTLEDNSHDSVLAQEQIRIAVKDAARYVLVTDPSQAPNDGREPLLVETLIRKVSRDGQTPYNHYGVTLDMAELTEKYLNEYSLKPAEGVIKTVVFNDDGSLTCTAREEYAYSEYDFDTHYWVNYVHLRSMADDSMETVAFEKQFASGKAPRLLRTLNGSYPDLQLVNRHLMYFDGYAYLCLGLRYKAAPLENTHLRVTAINGVPGNYGQFDFIPEVQDGMERSSAAIRLDGLSENAAVFTVEVVSNTDQQVLFRTDLTVEGMTPPAPTATPTPAPTAAPNPKAIVFEDDRVVVTMDKCINDLFFVHTELRVALKEPDKYVLVTDPSQAPDDPREAILLSPRQECVTHNVTSGLKSFDLADTDSASWRLMNELEKSVYHMTCFNVTAEPQADGSVLLRTVGDASEMKNPYDDSMAILTGLTFTDRSGETGRTEVFYRVLPSAEQTSRTVNYRLQGGYPDFSLAAAKLYYTDDYAYLSVKYVTDRLASADSALLTSDVAIASGLTAQVVHREEQDLNYYGGYPNISTRAYEHLLYRIDGLDSKTDVFYPTLTFYQGDEQLYTVKLVSNRVGDINGPTATPRPEATPAPTAAPAAASATFSIAEDAEVLSRYSIEVVQKVQKYSHYNATLLGMAEGFVLQPFFRYHDPLPEGTQLRLKAINDMASDFGSGLISPANLSSGPADLLTARIALQSLPESRCTFLLEAIHPDTGETIFALTLKTTSAVKKTVVTLMPTSNPIYPGVYDGDFNFPLKDAIEDGFDLTPEIDYGFFPDLDQWNTTTSPGYNWGWNW